MGVAAVPDPSTQAGALEPPAITTEALTKRFGTRTAVNQLDISVPRGVIAGFVGPNGSGKTTTIRMLLGLIRPTGGSGSVLGRTIAQPRTYLHQVGALIEAPAFYATMSGLSNLSTLATLGGHDHSRIPRLLEQVGLADRAGDKVRAYSLGMKQRLGIAAALLSDPQLLVLDEPANGLDPPGIIEMRDLMRGLRDSGKTLFISSHLLSEIEQLADWLVVLKDGGALYSGPAKNLPGTDTAQIIVATAEPSQLEIVVRIAKEHGYPVSLSHGQAQITASPNFAGELNRLAMTAGATITELHRVHATLEESFLRMISEEK